MIKDRLDSYKKIIREEGINLKEIGIENIIKLCQDSVESSWRKVSNNTNITHKDEKIYKVYDENNNIKETWLYTTNNDYDNVLFSLILLNYENLIWDIYYSLKNPLDEDEYLDIVEISLLKSLRIYDSEKNTKFITVFTLILKRSVFNEMYKNGVLHSQKIDGKLHKVIEYFPKSVSLDEILENNPSTISYIYLRNTNNEYSLLESLRDKYRKEGNLLGFVITDLYCHESYLTQIPKLMVSFKQNRDFKSNAIKKIYLMIFKTKLYKELGFTNSIDVKKFIEIKKLDLDKDTKLKKFNSFINKSYKILTNELYSELKGDLL